MIRDLLRTPFGPYSEEIILEDKCTSERNVLTLRHYLMECGGAPLGFDESEDRNNSRIKRHPVRFRGTLQINSLAWLKPIGRALLETELRERDIKLHWNKATNPTSTLNLAQLYGSDVFGKGLTISVVIQCNKLPMSASFYGSPFAPQGLIVYSKITREGRPDLTRAYEIIDIDISTYDRSHNFFRRYELLHLMERIVEEEYVLPANRTVNYFVDVYRRKFSFTEWHRYNRWLFNENADSDVDENGHTKLPRHPRLPHRSEVISIFASQADWLYEDQKAKQPRHKIVDLNVWKDFCICAEHARKEAAKMGIQWGTMTRGDYSCGGNDEVVVHKVKGKRKSKGNQRYDAPPPLLKRSESSVSLKSDKHEEPMDAEYDYDDDFAPVSSDSPATSDYDYLDDPSIDPELCALLPQSFHRPPTLPGSDFTWHCEVHGCVYSINLLQLTAEDVEGLSQDMVDRLRLRQWQSVKEAPVVIAFYQMVDKHRRRHLQAWDIEFTDPMTSKGSITWIHPRRHRSWPEPEPVRTKVMP